MTTSSPVTPSAPRRFHYLDGLRGLAALLVVLSHYAAAFFPLLGMRHPLANELVGAVLNGPFAVLIFFVLSGFVLAHSSAKRDSGLVATLVARYIRLTVPMLVSLILAWFWTDRFHDARVQFQAATHNSWATTVFYGEQRPSFFRAIWDGIYGVYSTGQSLFNNPVWTMRKELIGSVGVYLLYLLCPTRYRWWGLVFFAGVTLAGTGFLFGFPMGILFREAWTRGWIRDSSWSWLLLSLSIVYEVIAKMEATFNPALQSVAAGGVVLSAMTLPGLRALLKAMLPQFLGRISFALYLLHVPLLMSLGAWYYLHVGLPMVFRFTLGLILFLMIATALAWAMTIWIDEPLVKGLHRLKKHRFLSFGRAREGAKTLIGRRALSFRADQR